MAVQRARAEADRRPEGFRGRQIVAFLARRGWMACLTIACGILLFAAACHDGTAPRPDRITDALLFESDRDGQIEIYAVSIRTRRLWRLTEQVRDDYSPAWSPDRERIAFISERDSPDDQIASEVYVMRSDGTEPRRVTNTGTATGSPSWSPDGLRLAYASEVSGRARISIIDVDGSDEQEITEGTHDDYDPAWSPDGKRIAFVSNRLDTPTLWVMDAMGLESRRIGELEFVSRPTWSPDGEHLVVTANRQVFVVDLDTEEERRVSLPEEDARHPVWSPDGTRIAYTSDRFGPLDILIVDATSGALVQRLTDSQSSDLTGSWNWR